jgi:hypothetical protein
VATIKFTVDSGGSQDGHVARDNSAVYPPNTTSDPSTGPLIHIERAYHAAVQYIVSVGLLRFDTSAIPDTATITGATLTLTLHAAAATAARMNQTLQIEWYNHGGTIDAADYTATPANNAYPGLAVAALTPTSQWGKAVSFTLTNPAANISKTATTGFRLHISAFTPVPSLDQVAMDFYEAPADLPSRWAQLLVAYTVPPVENLAGSGSGGGGVAASSAAPRASVPWRFFLCDGAGQRLEQITAIATNRQLGFTLNRPEELSFEVPSDDERIVVDHTDGYPMLHPLVRTVKGYRKEASGYVLRYAGHVWQLEDSGDAGSAMTRVTCFGALQWLNRRLTGIEQGYRTSDGAAIAKHLVDTMNAESDSPVTTTGGTFELTEERTLTFDRRPIAECLIELANSFAGFDLLFEPLDAGPEAYGWDDDFTAGTIDTKWTQTVTGSGALAINSGRLRATKSTSTGTAEIRSHPIVTGGPSMDMRGRMLTAFVEDTTANASDHAGIRIRYVHSSTSTWWDLTRRVGNIVARQEQSGSGGDIATVASSAQWLRIREEGGTVYFEYSTDGTAWTLLIAVNPNGTSLTQMTTASVQAGLLQGTSSSAATVDIDNLTVTDPPLARINAYSRLGQDQPDLVLGWQAPPHNVASFSRTLDGTIVVNDLTVAGAGDLSSRKLDQTSIGELGLLMGKSALSDITNTAYLDALAQEELNFRLAPRELVEFTVAAGHQAAWEPWTHFRLGDTVPVVIGPKARGGFGGIMRIYGFGLTLDDANAAELVSKLTLAPEA